jgi:Uma2 family endonuclease
MNSTEPRPICWTKDEYYRLCQEGFFQDRRVELIGGEIVEMSAQKNWHAWAITATDKALSAVFGPNYWVRVQMSLDLSPISVPDPDLAVIAGAFTTHRTASNPTTALLVVEVSETTLRHDRTHKASMYAAAGITDYWIVNLVDRQVEVYRDPVPDPSAAFGYRYDSETDLQPGDVVSPLAMPTATVEVVDVLP